MMPIDNIAKWRGSCDLVELTPNVSANEASSGG